MSHHQVLLANLVGKTIEHFFVPADGKAVTIVLKEGRISLGAPVVRASSTIDAAPTDLATITEIRYPFEKVYSTLIIVTTKGDLVLECLGADAFTELPE